MGTDLVVIEPSSMQLTHYDAACRARGDLLCLLRKPPALSGHRAYQDEQASPSRSRRGRRERVSRKVPGGICRLVDADWTLAF